jgi:hypothetical protein
MCLLCAIEHKQKFPDHTMQAMCTPVELLQILKKDGVYKDNFAQSLSKLVETIVLKEADWFVQEATESVKTC